MLVLSDKQVTIDIEQGDITAGAEYYNPCGAYLVTLGTEKSVSSAQWGLRIASHILTDSEDYLSAPWCKMGAPEGSHLRSQVAKRYKFTSANLILAVVRGVIKQCFILEQIDANQKDRVLESLRNVKGKNNPTGRLVTTEEIETLLSASEDTPKGARDRAMIYTAYSCGLRRSEVGNVQLEHLKGNTLLIAGAKGNKTQAQFLSERALQYIEEWVTIRGSEAGALFARVLKSGAVGKGISARGYTEALKQLRIKAGVENFTTHDLRRSAITKVALETNIYTAQKFARHEDIETTLGYLRSANIESDLLTASGLF